MILRLLAALLCLAPVAASAQDGEVAEWDYETPDFSYDRELARGTREDAPVLKVTAAWQRTPAPNVLPDPAYAEVPEGTEYLAQLYASEAAPATGGYYGNYPLSDVTGDLGEYLSLQPRAGVARDGCVLVFDFFEDMVVITPNPAGCRTSGPASAATIAGAYAAGSPYTGPSRVDPADWQADLARADGELNAVWKGYLARLPASARAAAVQQERRWIARRDATCQPYAATYFFSKCLGNITWDRAAWLNAQARPG